MVLALIVCKVLCNVIGVNYYVNSNRTKYLAQILQPISYVLENFYRKFANIVAPTTDETSKRFVRCNSPETGVSK